MSVLAIASMALALSAHTPRVQLSVYTVNTCWHSELGYDTPSRYLALAGTPVKLLLLTILLYYIIIIL